MVEILLVSLLVYIAFAVWMWHMYDLDFVQSLFVYLFLYILVFGAVFLTHLVISAIN